MHCILKTFKTGAILSQMNCCIFFKQGLLQIFKSLPSRCLIHLFIGRMAPAKEIYVAPFGPVNILRCNIEKRSFLPKGLDRKSSNPTFFFFRPRMLVKSANSDSQLFDGFTFSGVRFFLVRHYLIRTFQTISGVEENVVDFIWDSNWH